MESSPSKKKLSLRLNPKIVNNISSNDSYSPKKARFNTSFLISNSDGVLHEEKRKLTADELLTILNDSSPSSDELSDEEWIVTKSRNMSLRDTPNEKQERSSDITIKKTGHGNGAERVSPLKLKRRADYEVNRLSSPSKKKTPEDVSPIVIKRKSESKKSSINPGCLNPSSKNNSSDIDFSDISNSRIRSQRRISSRHKNPIKDSVGSGEESDFNTPIKAFQQKGTENENSSVKKTRRKLYENKMECAEDVMKKVENQVDSRSARRRSCRKLESVEYKPSPVTRPSRSSHLKKINYAEPDESDYKNENKSNDSGDCFTPQKNSRSTSLCALEVQNGSNFRRSSRKSVRKKSLKNYVDSDSEPETHDFEVLTPIRKASDNSPRTPRTPSLRRQVLTPRRTSTARKKLEMSSPHQVKRLGSGFLSPAVSERSGAALTPGSSLERARMSLHASTLPTSLPCREREFSNISSFLIGKIEHHAGGCMYISGVPGTGKTATVHGVVRSLQEKAKTGDLSRFDFVEVNGLRLTEPRQAYVRIWQELSGHKVSADLALKSLENKFNKKNKYSTVLLVDELDYLCNRRQDVIYNILEWSTKPDSLLTVLTIANTMDLPERTLKGKVTSRMGLTRLVFQPYSFQQLQQIVLNRLGATSSFQPDAVQLVARKVAAVSGDARRALDICRRSTELVQDGEIVTVSHVQGALTQIFLGTRVQAIRQCSQLCQLVLRAIRDEVQRTGIEETNVGQIYPQLTAICALEGFDLPSVGIVLSLCSSLSDSGLILAERSRTDLTRKISLNVSPDDIHYALTS